MSDIKIAAIGGGTGLSTMLRGLKKYTSNVTAIVTVSDNGGGSGVLRQEMNMLPPGDIRNCILALSNTEPTMEKLFNYRFDKGSLSGQSFGNLFLAAMNEVLGSFEEAVKNTCEVLAITGKVLPVTSEDVQLCAKLEDGSIVYGETQIVNISKVTANRIKEVYLLPDKPKPLQEAITAIREADAIVFGPGSLYTSIIPNLLVEDIAEEIKNSDARKIYIGNVMTQPGETDGYNLFNHIEAIEKYIGKDIIEYVVVNRESIPNEFREIYKLDGAIPVQYEKSQFVNTRINLIEDNIMKILDDRKLVRHDSDKLAECIIKILSN